MSFNKSQGGFTPILVIALTVILAVVGGIFFWTRNLKSRVDRSILASPAGLTTNSSALSIKPITQDLKLIKVPDPNYGTPPVKYYEAGTVPDGPYKGYKRIVALVPPNAPGGPVGVVFATQDNKSYILDWKPEYAKLPDSDWRSPFSEYLAIDKTKISKVDSIASNHPQEIPLDASLTLYRDTIAYDSPTVGDRIVYQVLMPHMYSSYKKLGTQGQLTLYEEKVSEPMSSMLTGSTKVIAVDTTGLGYSYFLATPQSISAYKAYEKANDLYQNSVTDNPQATPPVYPGWPNTNLTKSQIKSRTALYDSYQTAYPHTCGGGTISYVVANLKDADVQQIGTASVGPIFALKDNNNQLLKDQYKTKMYLDMSPEDYKTNTGADRPSYEAYVSRPPLIFFKDYWKRWVVLGEYDYQLMGGCGKPVVYLYPPTDTKVSVKFTSPMRLDSQVPIYKNGWEVLAHPNGVLEDLHHTAADCQQIDTQSLGHEYIKQACQKNQYPYLYWSGQSLAQVYPVQNKGWIVERNNVSLFLNEKLDQIGLTAQEKQDMLSYWLPTMLAKQSPYYRVSFLQTAEMNKLVPMIINPQPQSIYRLFLDWEPLEQPPTTNLVPQRLDHIVRNGFTAVEWGGLKR